MSDIRPKILAIDDTPANLMVLARALANDYTIQLAASGPAGLAMAQASPPDLILLDIMMPGMDGMETCRRFKADPRLAAVPVIFITALTETEAEVEGLSLGAADFLHKPVNVPIAGQRIRNLLEREGLRRQVERNSEQLEQQVRARTQALSQANDELVQAKSALEAANRVKSAFLANMGHELRTPLNAILGLADLLKRQTGNDVVQDRAAKIENAGRLLLSIINDILYLTRNEAEAVPALAEPFSLEWLLNTCESRFQGAATAKGLRLSFEVAAGLPDAFKGAPSRLKQALDLLLDNAIKYSQQGTVSLRIEPVSREDGQLTVRFAVIDQGVGIAADQVDRLFDPFTQVDESIGREHGGIGVGLAICKHLVQMLGGTLQATSVPGQGSCFSFAIPLQLVAEASPAPTAEPAPGDYTAVPLAISAAALAPEVLDRLRQLAALLRVDDIQALPLWEQSGDALRPVLGERAAAFEAALDDFAFDAALAEIDPLLQQFPENS